MDLEQMYPTTPRTQEFLDDHTQRCVERCARQMPLYDAARYAQVPAREIARALAGEPVHVVAAAALRKRFASR